MKTQISLIALALMSATSAFASHRAENETSLYCQTTLNSTRGSTNFTITEQDAYDGVVRGVSAGGEAKFVSQFGPFNVKITHEPDMTIYSNNEEHFELAIVTTAFGGKLVTSANYSDGTGSTIPMTCNVQ